MPRAKKQHLKKRPDGRYLCRYKGKCFYGYTEDEALAAREDYKRELATGIPSGVPYFGEYALIWLRSYKAHLETETYNSYARALNKFLAFLPDRPITEIKASDIAAFYQSLSKQSASTIGVARAAIKGVFGAAYNDQIINRNPALMVVPPKGTKGTHRAITPTERTLIHQLDHRFRPAVMVMLYAGLRRGEVLALDIDRDVDFGNQILYVREAVRFNRSGRRTIASTKTQAGLRAVPLLDNLAAELRGFHGILCRNSKGEPMTEKGFSWAWNDYVKHLKAIGAPDPPIRPHDLRHSYCTMLYDAGVDLKTAMLWMGHIDQQTTMRIYTHLTDQRRTEAEKTLRNAAKTLYASQNASQDKLPEPGSLDTQGAK